MRQVIAFKLEFNDFVSNAFHKVYNNLLQKML